MKKIIASLPYHFHTKVTVIESTYKPGELTINELVVDLQVFKLHHLLSRHHQVSIGKGKIIAFKTIKGNDSSKEVCTIMLSDKDSSPNEEEMASLIKTFTRFFQKSSLLLVEPEEVGQALKAQNQ